MSMIKTRKTPNLKCNLIKYTIVTFATFHLATTALAHDRIVNNADDVTVNEENFETLSVTDDNGGAIYNSGANIDILNNYFLYNQISGTGDGGAIYNSGANAEVSGNYFTSNSAEDGSGGAVYNNGADIEILDNVFTSNTATINGGAVYNSGANTQISNSNFTSNVAEVGGAILNKGSNSEISSNGFYFNGADSGGAIFNTGTGNTISENNFTGNWGVSGGAIYNSGANAKISDNYFTSNSAKISGGAVYNNGNNVTISDSNFTENYTYSASIGGAAIYNAGNYVSVINAEFAYNGANNGGAIYNTGNYVSVTSAEFAANEANNGGAIYNSGTNSEISDSFFSSNSAYQKGGAIYNKANTVTIDDNIFTFNRSEKGGGAIYNANYNQYNSGANAIISNNTFEGNTTEENNGGAVKNEGESVTISGNTFTSNQAEDGSGGAIMNSGTNALIENNTFTSNKSMDLLYGSGNGGAIYNMGAETKISHNIFDSNEATLVRIGSAKGGAIYNESDSVEISDNTFTSNKAVSGGAIYNAGADAAITNSTFTSNSARLSGGAIYTKKDITIEADNGTSTFKDNYINDDPTDNEAIYVEKSDAILTFNAINNGNHYMYDYINGTDGYKVNIIGDGTGTMYLYNDIKNADIKVENTTVDIGATPVNTKNITFRSDSTLALKVNTLEEYGSVTANNITIEDGATLKATLAQNLVAQGEEAVIQLLRADNEDFNNFKDEFDNNMYRFEKAGRNGAYQISQLKTAKDVVIDAGAAPWVGDSAGAWIDSESFDGGTKAAKVADNLNDLAQHDAKGLIETIKAIAPTETPVKQLATIGQADRLTKSVDMHLRHKMNPMGFDSRNRSKNINIWGHAYIGESDISDRGEIPGANTNSRGVIVGIEKKPDRCHKVGIGLQYDSTDIDALHRDVDINTLTGFVYGEYKPTRWFVNGLAAYGQSKYDEKKYALGTHFDSKNDAQMISIAAMTGYQFKHFTPEMGLRYYHIMTDGYTDTAGQTVKDDKEDLLRGVVGVLMAENFGIFRPELYLGITYDINSDKHNTVVGLANGASYTVHGKNLSRLGYEASAGISAAITNHITASLAYMGSYRKNYREHTGLFKVRYDF